MSREYILDKIRSAVGQGEGQAPEPAPAVRIRVREMDMEARIQSFARALEALAGKFYRASSRQDACEYVGRLVKGKCTVASNAPYLAECGITSIEGVRTGFTDETELRRLSATADFGCTSADYALADTGSLV